MTELLFVGSPGDTLSQLQRVINAREPDWSVLQCAGTGSALEQLTRRPADIVLTCGLQVTDIESLFADVQSVSPNSMRLALFETPPLKVKGVHQALTARGDLTELHATLLAVAHVAARAAQHSGLQGVVSRFQDVPSPPVLYFDIRDELRSDNGTALSMAQVASRDPALVARTLRVANSGLYARPRSVGDLSDAIALIGADTLLGLVLAAHLYTGLPPPGLRLDLLWEHATRVSTLAGDICRSEGGNRRDVSHSVLAGLLHDIGLMVLLQNEAVRYQPMLKQSDGEEAVLAVLEQEAFGATHGELGALILTLWNLPAEVVDAVRHSHAVTAMPDETPTLAVRAVMAAEWLLDKSYPDERGDLPVALAETSDGSLRLWLDARDELVAVAG